MSTKPFNPEKESDILRVVCEYLEANKDKHGYFFWRQNNVPVFAKSNDGKMRFRALPKFTPRGLPDIMVIKDGLFYGIEVKRPGAGLREEQGEIMKAFQKVGAHYFVVRSLVDIQALTARVLVG